MPRPVELIVADIQAFTPSTDYQNYSGDQHLRRLFVEASESPVSAQAIPSMLNIIEHFTDTHFYYIYLVRALEKCAGYETAVLEAVQRHPTELTAWAAQRLKARPEYYDKCQAILEQLVQNPKTPPPVAKRVQDMLKARPVEQIIQDFEQFTPTPDLNYTGRVRLWDLCHELLDTPAPAPAIPAILNILERYPDEEFDVPGILVHTLEQLGGYESALLESVQRVPAYLSIVMMKRIIYTLELAGKPAEQYRRILQAVAPDELDF